MKYFTNNLKLTHYRPKIHSFLLFTFYLSSLLSFSLLHYLSFFLSISFSFFHVRVLLLSFFHFTLISPLSEKFVSVYKFYGLYAWEKLYTERFSNANEKSAVQEGFSGASRIWYPNHHFTIKTMGYFPSPKLQPPRKLKWRSSNKKFP